MWNFNDKGLKEAVVKSAQAFKPKDPKDAAHYDSVKASVVSEIQSVATNGVIVTARGGSNPEGRNFSVTVNNLKLTV